MLVDRNSSKQGREGHDYLTVYFFGNDDKAKVSSTNLNKALGELDRLQYSPTQLDTLEPKISTVFAVTDPNSLSSPIDSKVGYDNWQYYLTENRKSSVTPPTSGTEGLEGAASTGRTPSMILKYIRLLKEEIEKNEEYHVIFITHSLATKERATDIFLNNWSAFKDY